MLGRGGCVQVVCVVALLASASSASSAPVIVGTPVADLGDRRVKIAAHGDWLAWSEYDAADATFSLNVRHGSGPARRLGVKPRNRPFDIDAGSDRDDAPALVYSRCAREPKQRDTDGLYAYYGLPHYPGGSGCDIYQYSLSTGRERRLNDVSMRGAEEYMPSIWRGRVAFVREYPRGRTLSLYFNDRDGSRSRRLHRTQVADDIASVDLRGHRVAYLTARGGASCDGSTTREVTDSPYKTWVSVVEPARKRTILSSSCSNDARQSALAGPVWSNSTLIYSGRRGFDTDRGVIVARNADGQRRTIATSRAPNLYDYYLAANDHGIYGIGFTDSRLRLLRLLDVP